MHDRVVARYLVANDAFMVDGCDAPLSQSDTVRELCRQHPFLPEKRLGSEFWRCAWIEVGSQRVRADVVMDCVLAMNADRTWWGAGREGGKGAAAAAAAAEAAPQAEAAEADKAGP